MKNNYKFSLLHKEEAHISIEVKSDIFFKMLDFIEAKKIPGFVGDFKELNNFMPDEFYYIAHKILITKGKKRFFKGELVLASRENILLFLELSIKKNDLRSFIFAPVFSLIPTYTIFINDDALFFLYK
jgi:hypothetical protein